MAIVRTGPNTLDITTTETNKPVALSLKPSGASVTSTLNFYHTNSESSLVNSGAIASIVGGGLSFTGNATFAGDVIVDNTSSNNNLYLKGTNEYPNEIGILHSGGADDRRAVIRATEVVSLGGKSCYTADFYTAGANLSSYGSAIRFYTSSGTSASAVALTLGHDKSATFGGDATIEGEIQHSSGRIQTGVYYFDDHSSSATGYYHFKTNDSVTSSWHMVNWHMYGYAYGAAAIVDSNWGYYNNTSGALHSQCTLNKGSVITAHSTYVSQDDFVVLVAYTTNRYYNSVFFNIYNSAISGDTGLAITADTITSSATGAY